jgi:hypothetical protein
LKTKDNFHARKTSPASISILFICHFAILKSSLAKTKFWMGLHSILMNLKE